MTCGRWFDALLSLIFLNSRAGAPIAFGPDLATQTE